MIVQKLMFLFLFFLFSIANAQEVRYFDLPSGEEAEVRIFSSKGNKLLIGFACDEGKSDSEEQTSQSLSEDGIEVWMPNMLGAYMLPKARSSLDEIPSEDLVYILNQAVATKKDVYILASGPETKLLLKVAALWKKDHPEYDNLKGAILMFPRLNDGKPEPGVIPKYVASVGKTTIPLMVLEGGRTPNRWGLRHLTQSLEKGGSKVTSKIIPGIRGYFFKRKDPNMTEELVTSQLSGLVKVSIFYLEEAAK